MITKRLISSLFLLTILLVNIRQGESLKCHVCTSTDEKDNCWEHPENTTEEECGASSEITTTTVPATTPTTVAPVTNPTTAAPVTNPTTVAPVTNATTAAPATNPTTVAPVTNATTAAPATNPTTVAPVTNATTAAPATNPTTAAPATNPTTVAPVTNATTTTQPPPNPEPDTRAVDPVYQKFIDFMYPSFKKWRNEWNQPNVTRSKRDTTSDWECAKIITKSKEKKSLERKCVKKTAGTCNKTESDKECYVCSDKNLCNSASNIQLQLIPAFLSVFLALFFSSQ